MLRHLSVSTASEVSAFFTAKVPPNPQHSVASGSSQQLEPAHGVQQAQRGVADARDAQRVTRRMVGDGVRERGAHIVDAEAAHKKLRELEDALAQGAGRALEAGVTGLASQHRVDLAHRPHARRRR